MASCASMIIITHVRRQLSISSSLALTALSRARAPQIFNVSSSNSNTNSTQISINCCCCCWLHSIQILRTSFILLVGHHHLSAGVRFNLQKKKFLPATTTINGDWQWKLACHHIDSGKLNNNNKFLVRVFANRCGTVSSNKTDNIGTI